MNPNDPQEQLILIVGMVLFLFFFFIPSIVAFRRKHPHRWLILVFNATLGATGIVWLLCLIVSAGLINKPNNTSVDNNEPQLHQITKTDLIDKLERLGALQERGLISEQEFKDQKVKIFKLMESA